MGQVRTRTVCVHTSSLFCIVDSILLPTGEMWSVTTFRAEVVTDPVVDSGGSLPDHGPSVLPRNRPDTGTYRRT